MKNYAKSFINRETLGQFLKVGAIGVFNTVLYFALSNWLKFGLHLETATTVAIAFIAATIVSYLLNRRWSFGITDGVASMTEGSGFFVVNLFALALTELIVKGGEALLGDLNPIRFNLLNLLAAGIILIPKFAAYRDVVFRRSLANQRRS